MAEKKKEQERSVEERLKTLYQLQAYLTEIDRLRIQRGELPNEVKDLEDEVIRFQTRIAKYRNEIEAIEADIRAFKANNEMRKEKIARYEEQSMNVRNNREFSFLENEKEYEGLGIELNDKKIREATKLIEEKKEYIVQAEAELADNQAILEEKKNELDKIVAETRKDEEELMTKVKALEPLVDERTLHAFRRIRKNARNGLGIVAVQRDACGGCFNRIPPQRQLEIKMHKKILVCEYCGRIMVDPQLAGIQEAKAETAKPTRARRTRKKAETPEKSE